MKRNPRKVRWTKAFRKAHKKDLTVDTTLELEQRRNRPIKYNRPKMHRTLVSIQRISEIREKRERQYIQNRLKVNKVREVKEALKDLTENIHLIEAPESLREKKPLRIKEKGEKQLHSQNDFE